MPREAAFSCEWANPATAETHALAAQPISPADVDRGLDGYRRPPAAPSGRSIMDIEDGPSALGAPCETADLRESAARDSS
eukprot:8568055-Pyramimonas_sp.AAC.1